MRFVEILKRVATLPRQGGARAIDIKNLTVAPKCLRRAAVVRPWCSDRLDGKSNKRLSESWRVNSPGDALPSLGPQPIMVPR
jgi:hypothetical protein